MRGGQYLVAVPVQYSAASSIIGCVHWAQAQASAMSSERVCSQIMLMNLALMLHVVGMPQAQTSGLATSPTSRLTTTTAPSRRPAARDSQVPQS